MDSVQILRELFLGTRTWFVGTTADVTVEQANHVPPGVVHPIGELMAHVLHSEDAMISRLCKLEPVWERDQWSAQGGPMMLRHERDDARRYKCDPSILRAYSEAVYTNTDAYLNSLTEADLDVELDLATMGRVPVGRYLTLLVAGNCYAHTGEISALKGLNGNKGYPF